MNVELSGKTEKIEPYRFFGEGRIVDLMPKLIKAGYNPAGVAVLLERRENAPEDVRSAWQSNSFGTGDSATTDEKGGILLTLDSPLLRQLTPESPLVDGALKLEPEQWQELKKDKEHSLYLTPREEEATHGKGYVLKNGKFVPANKTVAKVWDHLNRGRDLQTYAQMASNASKSNDVLNIYFDGTKTLSLRSLAVGRISGHSGVYASIYHVLDASDACLAGVAQVARKKSLEARVRSALEVFWRRF